ncbi:GXWXG domain-containing protein [Rhizobium sp. P32RR-XVIII]|uniref:GXWXG domain-containing protein n=1 Tax=Rhizobium sp. P32RR-XVIII TaxID=2726738 RepID=UPI001981F5FD
MSFFDSLAPVSPDCLISLWQGHGISTGHPGRGFGKPWAVMANGSASRMPAL